MSNITLARKYWDKAFDYFFDGRPDRAIKAGRRALELNPSLKRPHWIIGQAFLHPKIGDRESAIKEFRQLVEKDPRWPHSHGALGAVLHKQGRVDEALKCYRQAFRLAPHELWTRIELADLLLKRNDYHEAIRTLGGIASPFCTLIDGYRLLGRAMHEHGGYRRGDRWREVWEHIMTFDESIPANRPAIAEARERLAEKPPPSPGEILLANLKKRETEGEANQ